MEGEEGGGHQGVEGRGRELRGTCEGQDSTNTHNKHGKHAAVVPSRRVMLSLYFPLLAIDVSLSGCIAGSSKARSLADTGS